MRIADIALLEADLIYNKRGSDHKHFARMMTATMECLYQNKTSREEEESIKANIVQNMVYQVCLLIDSGVSTLNAVNQIGEDRTEFFNKLNDEQRMLIKNTKARWTSNNPKTLDKQLKETI